jgi:hypothetical protein
VSDEEYVPIIFTYVGQNVEHIPIIYPSDGSDVWYIPILLPLGQMWSMFQLFIRPWVRGLVHSHYFASCGSDVECFSLPVNLLDSRGVFVLLLITHHIYSQIVLMLQLLLLGAQRTAINLTSTRMLNS